jgi:hypothetical protein
VRGLSANSDGSRVAFMLQKYNGDINIMLWKKGATKPTVLQFVGVQLGSDAMSYDFDNEVSFSPEQDTFIVNTALPTIGPKMEGETEIAPNKSDRIFVFTKDGEKVAAILGDGYVYQTDVRDMATDGFYLDNETIFYKSAYTKKLMKYDLSTEKSTLVKSKFTGSDMELSPDFSTLTYWKYNSSGKGKNMTIAYTMDLESLGEVQLLKGAMLPEWLDNETIMFKPSEEDPESHFMQPKSEGLSKIKVGDAAVEIILSSGDVSSWLRPL